MVGSPPELARRAALGDFDADVLSWLADGFRRHVIDGEAMEVALRLDRASRLRARDDALRRAAELLTLGDERPWTIAKRLAQAVAKHERVRSPATPLEEAIAAAFAAGIGVPETPRHMRNIIR